MKHQKSNLPKLLQWIFTALGALIAVGTVVCVIFIVFIERFEVSESVDLTVNLGEVRLALPDQTYTLTSETLKGEALIINEVSGDLQLNGPKDISGYLGAVRGIGTLTILFVGVMMFSLCELFRRLFKNVSRGEAFTESNVKNLHKIGVMIIALTIGGNFFASWTLANMASYLSENVEATGIEIDYTPTNHHRRGLSLFADYFVINVDFAGILGGMLVIALGEAFRQGLRLKEENELTI